MPPTFVGIGVPRAGTTWLNDLLTTHPDVQMSTEKEVHYFDLHFDKGRKWYQSFFPARTPAPRAIGEITPHYVYDGDCIERVADAGIDRLIVTLRDPVDRAVSHWRFRRQLDRYRGTFDDFLRDYPQAITWGQYEAHLRPWLERFGRDQLLPLVFETAVANVEATKREVATFVGVDVDRFPAGAGTHRRNESFVPRHGRTYAFARRQARALQRYDLRRTRQLAKRVGLGRAVSGRAAGAPPEPPVAPTTRDRLWAGFEPDVRALESLLGLDLSLWGSGADSSP